MAKIISCNSVSSKVMTKNVDDNQTCYRSGIRRTRGFHLLNIASTTGTIKAFIAVFGETNERRNKEQKRVSRALLPT